MLYSEKINRLIGMILDSVEKEISTNFILDAGICYDLSKELLYKFNANFENYEEDYFEELLEENEILSLCILNSIDGTVKYYLEPLYNSEGETFPDEDSDIVYIQDSLLDCVDVKVFDGQIAILIDDKEAFEKAISEFEDDKTENCDRDCSNCSCCNDDDIEEETIEVLFKELLSSIDELEKDDDLIDNIYDLIRDKLEDTFDCGYNEGVIDSANEVQDLVEDIKSLIVE